MAPLSVFSRPILTTSLTINKQASGVKGGKRTTVGNRELLPLAESKGSSERTDLDLSANERTGSCTVSECDCTEQCEPGAVHHLR